MTTQEINLHYLWSTHPDLSFCCRIDIHEKSQQKKNAQWE